MFYHSLKITMYSDFLEKKTRKTYTKYSEMLRVNFLVLHIL